MIEFVVQRKVEVEVPALGNTKGTVFFGPDDADLAPIEVLVLRQSASPSHALIREIQKWRKNDRVTSVVVAIEVDEKVHLYGPSVDRQPIALDLSAANRILQSALIEPNPVIASRQLVDVYDNFGSSEMPGVKNKGLFASHHIRENLPKRRDWAELREQGEELATKRHRGLIEALGFSVFKEERNTFVLKAKGPENRVIAILLEDAENFESPSGRFPSSPVAWGLSVAAEHNVPWLIMLKKDQIRLHPGRDGVGVGQKGQAETFLELNLAQIDSNHLALLPLIFSAQSLESGGEVQTILEESSKFAVVLGARLRERVYESVVPSISIAVAKKMQQQGKPLDSDGLQTAYSLSLRILFRLLFQAYAEDRALLPLGRNEGYDANSLKTIARRDMGAKPEDFGEIVGIWHDLVQVWDAIDEGNPRWQIPAYNGGLFGRDPVLHPQGALIKELELTDAVLGPALQALLIDKTVDGVMGPVDFKSLSVREFGTIYEGLLESSLSLADVDLTVNHQDAWVPAKPGDSVMAKAGEPYFHSASGERKATGSYFTPKFVVDHLVEQAIDATIDKHLEKIATYLRNGDQSTAAREFFDFRVADLAMGSAHFLVAAIDRIEAKMRSFLANPQNIVPGVIDELSMLRKAATEALIGDEIAIAEIEDSSLLRRQIARRCIYGIDINDMAVELARLAIWIHTFVPGLPMSSLNHNLVCANSLTGIGSVDEALDALIPNRQPGLPTMFDAAIARGLDEAKVLLIEAAKASEADKREVAAGLKLAVRAIEAAQDSKFIFDAAIAARFGSLNPHELFTLDAVVSAGKSEAAKSLSRLHKPAHMPYLFPEVFLKDNAGFDVLLGNPPWEKLKIEEHQWWGIRIPGLRGLPIAKRNQVLAKYRSERPDLEIQYENERQQIASLRDAIVKGPLRQAGATGDPDLYQAFAWRNWQLLRQEGRMSLVLPRTAMSSSGLKEWRRVILENGSFERVVFGVNTRNWIFDTVHQQYSISFTSVQKRPNDEILFAGPFHSKEDFDKGRNNLAKVSVKEFFRWSDSLSFPSFPSEEAVEIFLTLKNNPSLTGKREDFAFEFATDLHASQDKDKFDTSSDGGQGLLPIFSGASFNLWDPAFGKPFAYGPARLLLENQRARIISGTASRRSAYFAMEPSEDYLNSAKPRIGIRAISNSTNSRTVIACLLPPRVLCTHQANVIINLNESASSEAYLLGVLSSIPFDWYARRLTELSVSLEMMRNSPVPLMSNRPLISQRIVTLAGRLAATKEDFRLWCTEIGIDVEGGLSENERNEMVYEIDALVSLMYKLSSSQVEAIFESFHRGWDYKPRLARVLEYFDQWKDK